MDRAQRASSKWPAECNALHTPVKVGQTVFMSVTAVKENPSRSFLWLILCNISEIKYKTKS